MEHSQEKAAWGIVDPKIDPVQWFKEHIGFGSGDIHAVWLPEHPGSKDGHSVLLAIVGNGPKSEANAKRLVEIWNGTITTPPAPTKEEMSYTEELAWIQPKITMGEWQKLCWIINSRTILNGIGLRTQAATLAENATLTIALTESRGMVALMVAVAEEHKFTATNAGYAEILSLHRAMLAIIVTQPQQEKI